MSLPRSIRILVAMAILVLGLAAILLILVISEATLNIQARLDASPVWLKYAWWSFVTSVCLLVTWLVWRFLHQPDDKAIQESRHAEISANEASVSAAVEQAEQLGADTSRVRSELAELARRKSVGTVHVALFGEISSGKSTLLRALVPDADATSDVLGGTTRTLTHHTWTAQGGDSLVITDMPGIAEADGELDTLAMEEAQRAHIVIYVSDGDLNRAQHSALQALLELNKPLILALNKTDRYSTADLAVLSDRLHSLIADQANTTLVRVSAGGRQETVRVLTDGSEEVVYRDRPPDVSELSLALQRMIDGDQNILDQLRDTATFVLASRQLDSAIAESRRKKAESLVDSYSKKAVIGAMAAITPGSDLLIQGVLGTQMVRELAALYDTKVGKVDTELLLKLVQKHVGRADTLLLAVAGNALKSFPGVGTLAGGAMHAVAYGIIFRTLGRALTTTLATRGELHPRQTARLFEEKLGEDLETPARSLARLVVERARGNAKH
jgi:predicted GTPase